MILSGAQPPPVQIPQPPNGAANNAVYQAAMRQKQAQAGGAPGVAARAALNGQPLGQRVAPPAPGVVPPSFGAIQNAIEIGQSTKDFALKLPQARKQSQSAPGASGAPNLPMGQPSTAGQPNHNPAPHPSSIPVPSLGPQSRPVGVPTAQNGNQAAANSVANFHGQNPQASPMQQQLANQHFAAMLAHKPMAGSVARPASASQNHPPNGQMQPPQAGRVPQQEGLVQHPQHTGNPQLAAYLHGQAPQPHQPPGGVQPAQPAQPAQQTQQTQPVQPVQPHSLSLLSLLPVNYQAQLLQHKAQFLQHGPEEKKAWLDRYTEPQLKNHPDWQTKTDEEKANMALNFRAKMVYQRIVYNNMQQRMAGRGQNGQGMMPTGMMPNGMMPNGMMPNGMIPNGMMPNGMMARMPGAHPMVGMVGMPGAGMPGMPGMMQNMGGMPGQPPPPPQ